MSLDSIVKLSISTATKSPTRPGFGVPMLLTMAVPAGWGTSRSRLFGSLTELLDAGFDVTSAVYQAAQRLLSAEVAPSKFRVGRRLNLATQTIKLTVTNITPGHVYDLKVNGKQVTYKVPGGATAGSVAVELSALMGVHGVNTSTTLGGDISVTSSIGPGNPFDLEGWSDRDGLVLENVTSDPNITADLASIFAENSDWYALTSADPLGHAEILSSATWAESNRRIFVQRVNDTAAANGNATTDIGSTLKASGMFRTHLIAGKHSLFNFEDMGILGSRLPAPPGSDTWAFKTLPAVSTSNWTEGEKSALLAKNYGVYTTESGVNFTEGGKSAGGEWMDVVRFRDWLESEIKVRVFAALLNSPKLPYSNAGRDVLVSVIEGALADGVSAGGLDANPPPAATAPRVEDIDPTIRATRKYPGLGFTGRLAGAIHAVEISGTLSV